MKYNNVSASHRLDIGINTDKIKLTPKHDEPIYAQSLPTSTNLKDDLLVELALMQEYGIITTLPYSKYSSPIFAQRKPNGKLRILVDLRRINHLLKNDYNQHNHPVTNIADAAQHMAGKKYFCKLDCSPLPSDGRRTTSTTASVQLRGPYLRLPAAGTGTQLIPLGIQQHSPRIRRCTGES